MTEAPAPSGAATDPKSQRVDKWLWHARVARTRTTASALVTDGRVRINRERVVKPGAVVRPGDVITVATGPYVRALKVKGFAERRGSASAAAELFEELTVSPAALKPQRDGSAASDRDTTVTMSSGRRDPGSGRPTKRDRRMIARLTDGD